jgi:hypothetical protein
VTAIPSSLNNRAQFISNFKPPFIGSCRQDEGQIIRHHLKAALGPRTYQHSDRSCERHERRKPTHYIRRSAIHFIAHDFWIVETSMMITNNGGDTSPLITAVQNSADMG